MSSDFDSSFKKKKNQAFIHKENTFPLPFPGSASLHHSKHLFSRLVTTAGHTGALHGDNRQCRACGQDTAASLCCCFLNCSPLWAAVSLGVYRFSFGSSINCRSSEEVSAPVWVLHRQQLLWEPQSTSSSNSGVPFVASHSFVSSFSLFGVFYPFLNTFSWCGWQAQLCLAVVRCGPGWSQGIPWLPPTEKPCSLPTAKTLMLTPNTKLYTYYQEKKNKIYVHLIN